LKKEFQALITAHTYISTLVTMLFIITSFIDLLKVSSAVDRLNYIKRKKSKFGKNIPNFSSKVCELRALEA
jgi:hypothetical protein